ncbi:MAG TPA: RNA polymerase sigma factor [Gemmatales bacterium]|nr:RNA polymerase sigma factor [Gemmatales bacterium]
MNPRQLADLVDRHGPALVLYARQWSAVPEDIVQEAFLKLIRQGKMPPEPVAWLHRVVRNAAIDAARVEQRRLRRESAVVGRWFTDAALEGLDVAAAVAALADLPVEQREGIVARLWGGLSFEQIAELAGVAASTAHRRFAAGLAALRERLGLPQSLELE